MAEFVQMLNFSHYNYPNLLVFNEKGYDLSSVSNANIIIRNNNANTAQLYLILKAGKSYKWYELINLLHIQMFLE